MIHMMFFLPSDEIQNTKRSIFVSSMAITNKLMLYFPGKLYNNVGKNVIGKCDETCTWKVKWMTRKDGILFFLMFFKCKMFLKTVLVLNEYCKHGQSWIINRKYKSSLHSSLIELWLRLLRLRLIFMRPFLQSWWSATRNT